MAKQYDAIIIGGGHNGLVTACYLARAKWKVLVLERRYIVGGACVSEETFPGFKVSTAAYVNSLFRPEIIRDLRLADYGFASLERNPSSFSPFQDGRYLLLGPDGDMNRREISKFSTKDAENYPKYEQMLERVAASPGIDTEPRFSPDGQWIYFTSDRSGSPQIYRLPVSGGTAERITFNGSYNVTPRPSPDGKSLAFIARDSGRFQLSIMDLASRQIQILTDSARDESPTFAPNGRMILYATEIGGRGVLAAVSSDGSVKLRLPFQAAADVREPAWGPFVK